MGDSATEAESSSSDGSSDSGGLRADDQELESMTGKGIKHLCLELLELKKAAEEDFQRNIYSSRSAFIRIFEKVGDLEIEILQLKQHILTQGRLVQDLTKGFFQEVISEVSIDSLIEQDRDVEECLPSELETYVDTTVETLDVLLSEHRLEEALVILERESNILTKIQLDEHDTEQALASCHAKLSERRARLTDQFVIVAEHQRISAPELQNALSALLKLGHNHRANTLLLKYYHRRLADGLHDLLSSKPVLHGAHVRELAKTVFSVISQAARSFVSLNGESSPYASELMQWAREEIEVLVYYFHMYVKSISETNGGLYVAAEAVKIVTSFCALLETQKIVLVPYLIKLLRPCMEEVLQIHVDCFKKIASIFAASDTWDLLRFPTLGILKEGSSLIVVGSKLDYFLLTNSGRKFVTLTQAVVEDISPLVILQMEESILNSLADLFNDYIVILEKAISSGRNIIENDTPRISPAQTLPQQLSILVNSSTLLHFFSSIFKSFIISDNEESPQLEILDCWFLLIKAAVDRLRDHFCKQFVVRIMTSSGDRKSRLMPEMYADDQGNSALLEGLMPSVAFQELFLQLRQIEKIARDIFAGLDLTAEDLLKELLESVFHWVSDNEESRMNSGGSSNMQKSGSMGQFVLDMHFLLEIARFGGYLCDDLVDASSELIASTEAAFTESQSDPCGVIFDDAWASDAAKTSIERLLRIETEILFIKEPSQTLEEDSVVHGDPGNSVEEDCYSPGDSIGLTVYIDDASETESLIQQNTVETELAILETSIAVPEDGDVDKEIKDANESHNRGDILQIPKELEKLVSGISANIDEESCDEQELDITVSVEESVTLTLVDRVGESNNLVVTMASLSTDEQFDTIGIRSSEMGVAEIGDSHISQGGDAITADLEMNNSETLSDVEETDVVHGHDLDNLPCPEAAYISTVDYHSLETIIVCGREDKEDNNLPEVTSSLGNLLETKTTGQIKQADGKSLDPVSVENSNKQQERHETDPMEGDIGSRKPDEQESVRIVRSSGSKRKGAKENHRWK